jgi:hypothetical protein
METGLAVPIMGSPAPSDKTFSERLDLLCASALTLARSRPRPRQERLSGLHNPWGFGAGVMDPWLLLDVCEHSEVLDHVEALIGPDIVLWDTELYLEARSYREFVSAGREGRYWPATPLQGAVVIVPVAGDPRALICKGVDAINGRDMGDLDLSSPVYVLRYMPATSRFIRDPKAPANWTAMQEQPLVNFTRRPLWLVRGEDRAGNDFVTGFSPSIPRWAVNSSQEI